MLHPFTNSQITRIKPHFFRSICKTSIRHVSKNALLMAEESESRKVLLGRPSNNLKMGVVGMPNIGKSTFFNCLTKSSVAAENYPFCTIDPSEAKVAVSDSRFEWLCQYYKTQSIVPAFLTVTDIAGLVKGASEGAGLGNAFLNNVRSVDGIFHVCRAFDHPDVVHVENNKVDPVRDLEIIHDELRLKDAEYFEKGIEKSKKELDKLSRTSSSSPLTLLKQEEYDILRRVEEWLLQNNKDVRMGEWTPREVEILNTFNVLTAKPVIYLANVSEEEYASGDCKWLQSFLLLFRISKIQNWIDLNYPGDSFIPFSAELEINLMNLENDEERQEYLSTLGTNIHSALPEIAKEGYRTLQLCHYFTCGKQEVRAWTIQKGTMAPQAAGVIHSDFEKGFIMAEVMKYSDLKSLGSESLVKSSGKYYQKGRDYIVEDGDICHFKFKRTTKKK